MKENDSKQHHINVAKEMKQSYLCYALSVVTGKNIKFYRFIDKLNSILHKKINKLILYGGIAFGSINQIYTSAIFSPLRELYSSSIYYFNAKIKTKTVIDSASELKRNNLDYSPQALVKYGIIQNKEKCIGNTDDEERLIIFA